MAAGGAGAGGAGKRRLNFVRREASHWRQGRGADLLKECGGLACQARPT